MTRHRRARNIVVPHVAAALSRAALTAAAPIARMLGTSSTMVLLALPLAAQPAPTPTDSAYVNEIHTWHAQRLARLQADTGYLALAGLFWLADGEHTLGSDAANAIVLPAHSAPPQAGVLVRSGDTTVLRALPGAGLQHDGKPVDEMTLVSDAAGAPTVIAIGDLTFSLIKRGDRYAIRLRDKQSAIRKNFRGIECFPIDTAYKVPARFVPYSPPKKIPIANVVGTVDTMLSPGALVFTLHDQECRLDPVWEGPEDDSLWLIFRDVTSGEETYGNGRFLYTALPQEGRVDIDFNRAYNPPCAFSPYTTCPLPPLQNELSVPVRAGEKTYNDPSGH